MPQLTLKVNGYTFMGSNSCHFHFASLFNGDQLLQKKICSFRSNFFPLRVDPILEGFRYPEKRIQV